MSSNNFSSYSSSSYSYSSSGSSNGGQVRGSSHSQHVQSDNSGTTVSRQSQNLGEPAVRETRHFDNQGRELVGGPAGNESNRITDAEQDERDHQYEERMEDEYAKREGGA